MAKILYQMREETTNALLEASLATREPGYTDEAGYQELTVKTQAGAYRHFPSRERLDDTTSGDSGASIIGVPSFGGYVSTNLEDLLIEMNTSVAGSGVALFPASSTRNRIQPTGDFIGLVVRGNASQTVKLFVAETSAAAEVFSISAAGDTAVGGTLVVTGNTTNTVLVGTGTRLVTATSAGLLGNATTIAGNYTFSGTMIASSTLAVTGTSTFSGIVGVGGSTSADTWLYLAGTAGLSGTTQNGIDASPVIQSGATTAGRSVNAQLRTQATSFTMVNGAGIRIASPNIGAGSAVTTLCGLDIANQSGGSTNYAIRTGTGLVTLGDAVTMASTLAVTGLLSLAVGATFTAATANINFNTVDGSDNGRLTITGAGGTNGDVNRGAYIDLRGNENGSAGALNLVAGNAAGGIISFYTGNALLALSINETKVAAFTGAVTMASTLAVTGITLLTGAVGFGLARTEGQIHVFDAGADAGSVTANTSGDTVVIEGAGNHGISILSPDANQANIYFGSPSANLGALIRWNYSGNVMHIGPNNASALLKLYAGGFTEIFSASSTLVTVPVALSVTGNVGIGTNASGASAPLAVAGANSASAEVFRLQTGESTGAASSYMFILSRHRNTVGANIDGGTIRFTCVDPTTTIRTSKIGLYGSNNEVQTLGLEVSPSGIVTAATTTDSTSLGTGALIVNGGIGVAKRLTIDGATGKTLRIVNATANAAVATTLGSVGPTGSTAGNPQGWMRIDINGTDRYMPFW